MKKALLSFFLLMMVGLGWSQSGKTSELTCLDKYKKIFKDRGADHVPDGMHRNVIITITDEYGTNCFYGKSRVEGTTVSAIFLKLEDDSYELLEQADFTNPYGPKIRNGVSDKWVTKDGRTMQVVFVDNIKPKKKQYVTAPDPDPDKL